MSWWLHVIKETLILSTKYQGWSHLQVGREGVRKPHVTWEGTEDEVAELDAVGRDDVTEAVVVVAQELWEVVQEYQKYTQRALAEVMDMKCNLGKMPTPSSDTVNNRCSTHISLDRIQTETVVYLVENLHRFVELYIPQEGGQVLEQINQQLSIHGPTLEDKEN